jgi:hypothetical protein
MFGGHNKYSYCIYFKYLRGGMMYVDSLNRFS